MQADILLVTLNASYHHSAFGLRYIMANMGDLSKSTKILEFTITQKAKDIVEKIILHKPKIVGFGIYIWNTRETYSVISILKAICPDTLVVIGGPEVSYESENQSLTKIANFVIQGEADFLFYNFSKAFLAERKLPETKIIKGDLPEIAVIHLPYGMYTDEDIRNRVLYVEASRGCPYKCEYCLSSLDVSVRNFPLEKFLGAMELLIARGAKQFKFVDRTFNLSPSISTKILQFFLDRIDQKLFLHFEMVPDRLPQELKEIIRMFPAGSIQFEIGIQTWNPQVAKLVSRRQDYKKIKENLRFLKTETQVHTHADLIVGLPGEGRDSFAKGFDAVLDLEPDEIQVGILKRLKGTPIIRHDQEWKMLYQEEAPFSILQTKLIPFAEMRSLERFAKFWDLYANSGNFLRFIQLLRKIVADQGETASFFEQFFNFSEFLSQRHPENYGIALLNLVESAWIYLVDVMLIPEAEARAVLVEDYAGRKKREIPYFLRAEGIEKNFSGAGFVPEKNLKGLKRQAVRI